ncbi:hypothetical protein [Haladaptatus sp. R4]|uniref:hypothetical protein n=1 Tax=Haladaptatus sp. R4 TaxID=1679489 RepID=UPI0016812B5C|nr:hypothetical protein [Haladaptatus sp. R4]
MPPPTPDRRYSRWCGRRIDVGSKVRRPESSEIDVRGHTNTDQKGISGRRDEIVSVRAINDGVVSPSNRKPAARTRSTTERVDITNPGSGRWISTFERSLFSTRETTRDRPVHE